MASERELLKLEKSFTNPGFFISFIIHWMKRHQLPWALAHGELLKHEKSL
jgi:hypothetical protein